MREADPPAPGALFLERFRIEGALGQGGMGEVWAALDTRLERPVAIKIIHPRLAADAPYAARFLREMKIVARLAHPNIVRLYDAGAAADGRLYMIMERVFGVPLRERIGDGARLEATRALHYAIQVAEALGCAHREALVHRDVKPENILICDEVHARLLDFGVAKDARALGLTRQGAVVGTSRYMAPEQTGGRVDARADLYALGVVLYEMVAGAHPYPVLDVETGIGETEVQAAHVHLAPTPLPEVLPGCPEGLWQAVATCLAKRPEDRYARAEDLADALRAVAQAAMGAETAEAAQGEGERAIAREIRREAADAARARAVRGGEGAARSDASASMRQSEGVTRSAPPAAIAQEALLPPQEALLPPQEASVAPPGPAVPEPSARERLGMAQVFKVTPGGLTPVRTAAAGVPAPDDLEGAATNEARAGEGEGGRSLVRTEPWSGAAAASHGGAPLARTEPWDAVTAGAGATAGRVGPAWARWGLLFAVGVVVLGLLAAALAGWG